MAENNDAVSGEPAEPTLPAVSPAEIELLGLPKPEPTIEQVAAGRFGNGVDLVKIEMQQTILRERRQLKTEAKAREDEAYAKGRRDALGKIAAAEDDILTAVKLIAGKAARGEVLEKWEQTLLNTGLKSIQSQKEFAIGKPKATVEVSSGEDALTELSELYMEWRG